MFAGFFFLSLRLISLVVVCYNPFEKAPIVKCIVSQIIPICFNRETGTQHLYRLPGIIRFRLLSRFNQYQLSLN